MQRINEAFYSYLTKQIPAEVEVFPAVADESAQYPFCVFRMERFEAMQTKPYCSSWRFIYTVSLWGSSFNQVDRLATQLMAAADRRDDVRFDKPAGRMRIALAGGECEMDGEGFAQHLTYDIKYDGDVC